MIVFFFHSTLSDNSSNDFEWAQYYVVRKTFWPDILESTVDLHSQPEILISNESKHLNTFLPSVKHKCYLSVLSLLNEQCVQIGLAGRPNQKFHM